MYMLYTQELSSGDKLFEYTIVCCMKYMNMHAQTRSLFNMNSSYKFYFDSRGYFEFEGFELAREHYIDHV